MRKIIISLVLILLLTGCWNYKELNNYCIVTGIAIDKADNGKYEVSFLISNSINNNSDTKDSESKIVVYSGKGKSIYEAIKNIGLITPKELYIGHTSILIISDEIAKEGVSNVIDFFVRFPEVRKDFFVILARDCKAKDALKVTTPLSSFPSQNIYENISSTSELQGVVYALDFNHMLEILLNKGQNITINSIKILGNKKKGSSNENLESTQPKAMIKLDTLGIFKNDKFVKWTTKDESRGINILNNEMEEMYITIKYNDGYIVLKTESLKSKSKVKLINNSPAVDINIKAKTIITEVDSNIDLTDVNTTIKIQKLAEKELVRIVNKAINLAKDEKTDILGFGELFYKKYPKYFKSVENNWHNDILPNVKTKVKCIINIDSKGTAKTSIKEKLDE